MLSPSDIHKAIDTIHREHELLVAIITPASYCERGDGHGCDRCNSSQSCETNIKELFHQYVYSTMVHFNRELDTMRRAGVEADHVQRHLGQHSLLAVAIDGARDRFAATLDRCEAISSLKTIARSIDDHIATMDAEMIGHLMARTQPSG